MSNDAGPATLEPAPIVTERLLLRPHRMDDLDDLVPIHGDPEVVRFIPWPVRDRAATEKALRAKTGYTALRKQGDFLIDAVEVRETGTVIGEVMLRWGSVEDHKGELGYAFGRAHHGHGYAAEAATAMLHLGFEDFGLRRIEATCVEDNVASARLLRRLGFTLQARLADNEFFKGHWINELVFAITADEWRVSTAVRTFFAAFTSGPTDDVDGRLAGLREVMLPQAIVVRTCGEPLAVYDVESFIAPRRELLTDGSLTGFAEHTIGGRVEVYGDIAHWFGHYEKSGRLHGEPYAGAGAKSVQLVRTPAGWRISAVAWDDERPGDGTV